MKTIFHLLLVFFMAANIYAAEPLPVNEEPGASTGREGPAPVVDDLKDWQLVVQRPDVSPEVFESFTKILKKMTGTTSIDDVPIEILLQEQALLKSLLVSGGFYLKSTAITAANLYAWISPFNFGSLLKSVSSPALYNYAHKITEGDLANFPEISLNYVCDLLDEVPDRRTFAGFPLRKRAFHFDTNGFNGFGKGYLGYAIVQDFAYGERLVQPGEEYSEISKYVDKNPLDCLVSLKQHILLSEWLRLRFVRPNPMNLRKAGYAFKDMFGNTCLLYELPAHPESLFLLVMRKPEKEYLEITEIWKEVWRRNHAGAPQEKLLTTAAEGTAKK